MTFSDSASASTQLSTTETGLRPLGFPVRLVRRRPWTALVLLFLLLAGAGGGTYAYALHEWKAAHMAIDEDRPQEARDRLRICMRIWPQSVSVNLFAARVARLNGDLEGTEALLKRCSKLAGGATAGTQLEFLLLRLQAGEADEVTPSLIELVDQKHPESPMILETMARAYMHNLQYGPAFACLSRWIEVAPNTARAYYYRGWVRERLDMAKDAMADYEQTLKLDPEHFDVRLRIAEMMLEDTRSKDALQHLEWLNGRFPGRAKVMARLGHCYLLQGKEKEARTMLEAAVKELPDDPPLLHNLAKLELQDSRPADAETWLRHALKVDPADTEALYTLHSALQLQGRKQESVAIMEEYDKKSEMLNRANRLLKEEAKHPSEDAAVQSELGTLLLSLGQDKQGIRYLNEALMRDPAHQPTYKILIEYYERKGPPEKAVQFRNRLAEVTKRGAGP